MFAVSKAEKSYLLEAIALGTRVDGRSLLEYRPISVQVGVLPSASGSSRLRLGETEVLVGVKVEVGDVAEASTENIQIHFTVECSGSANADFLGREAENWSSELQSALESAYQAANVFDEDRLKLVPGKFCWVFNVDILVLDTGGNMLDAISMATRAAFSTTLIPRVYIQENDGVFELEIDDNPNACDRLHIHRAPTFLTFALLGNNFVLDPSLQEETSARGKFSVAVDTNGDISYVYSFGLLDGVEMSKLLTIVKKTGKLLLDRLDHSIENDSSST
ncbi:hypothetical protein GAYE_PCTG69G1412 [Galdieria yellowstonensis]|uniref:Ribosomal RNA-processing protein 42 n=1 Tax=Galdieria yellowstonensis TaxID=3028027 RepID=A0AAV9I838_9RHOD|nr:hypothetical protein GAYE_PCTG69G1412 [Galdieria yellowstonensis]